MCDNFTDFGNRVEYLIVLLTLVRGLNIQLF